MGLVLAAACTAPPRPQPAVEAPPAPPPTVHVTVAAPGLTADAVEAQVVPPLEQALAPLPGVKALVSRADDGRAELIATLPAPGSFEAVYRAMQAGQTLLPYSTELPVVHRGNPGPPVFVTTLLDDPFSVAASIDSFARLPGVARVDACGGGDPSISIDLDPSRLAGRATDDVVRLLRFSLFDVRDSTLPTFEELPDLTLGPPADGAPPLRLRDIAVLRRTATPRPCRNLLDRGQVTLLVVPQVDADPDRVLADIHDHLRSPSAAPEPAPAPVPPDFGLPPAVLDLELADTDRAPQAVAACLRAVPSVTNLALVQPEPGDAPVYARLYVSARPEPAPPAADAKAPPPPPTFPIGPVREALSACTGVHRVAVVAPLAQSDHPLTVEVIGPEHGPLARVADAAAARLRELPAVTHARVRAAREVPQQETRLDREQLATRGVPVASVADLLRLAVAPVDLGRAQDGAPIRVDLTDRTGPLDQVLARLTATSAAGPVPLSALVRVEVGPPILAPRWRVDGQRAALVELRLRRAADRSAVEDALKTLDLPPGLRVRLGPALPLRTP